MTDTLAAEAPVEVQVPPTQEEPAGPQEPEAEQVPPAPILETAFIVYMNPQGHWMVADDIHLAAEMQTMRKSGVDDFFSGCSTVLRDIAVQETASTALGMLAQSGIVKHAFSQAMEEMAEKARQAQMNAEVAKLATGGGGALDLSRLKSN